MVSGYLVLLSSSFPLQCRAQHRHPRQKLSVYQNNTLFGGTPQALRDGKGGSGDVYTNLVVGRVV